jgi:hypothetical protein
MNSKALCLIAGLVLSTSLVACSNAPENTATPDASASPAMTKDKGDAMTKDKGDAMTKDKGDAMTKDKGDAMKAPKKP